MRNRMMFGLAAGFLSAAVLSGCGHCDCGRNKNTPATTPTASSSLPQAQGWNNSTKTANTQPLAIPNEPTGPAKPSTTTTNSAQPANGTVSKGVTPIPIWPNPNTSAANAGAANPWNTGPIPASDRGALSGNLKPGEDPGVRPAVAQQPVLGTESSPSVVAPVSAPGPMRDAWPFDATAKPPEPPPSPRSYNTNPPSVPTMPAGRGDE